MLTFMVALRHNVAFKTWAGSKERRFKDSNVTQICVKDYDEPTAMRLAEAHVERQDFGKGVAPFTVGARFFCRHEAAYRDERGPQFETSISRCRVTHASAHGFEYVNEAVLDLINPPSFNPQGSTRVGTRGGATYDYAMTSKHFLPIRGIEQTPDGWMHVVEHTKNPPPPPPPVARWIAEFGADYAVPHDILQRSDLEDTSWHNDVCPSFALIAADGNARYRLWVEHTDPALRETGEETPRFIVSDSDGDDPVYAGDDVTAALAALDAAGPEQDPNNLPDEGEEI